MKVSTTSERLKYILKTRDIKQVDILNMAQPFCVQYGVKLGKNDLSQYVNGKVEPGQEKLTVLGLALDVSETWLMGYNVPIDREKPAPETENGLSDISAIYNRLSPDNRAKLLELARLYLDHQHKSEGNG